jgi:predicted nucleic acid-binding Zn ribbon protein
MHCPTCGQKQISEQTRFCSRCGFLLTDVAEVVANKGISPYKTPSKLKKKDSPRKRGIKQGAMLMLVGTLLVVPIIAILIAWLGVEPFAVPIAAIISFMGGLLRIIYAFMFESPEVDEPAHGIVPNTLASSPAQKALPQEQSIPASAYNPPKPSQWIETNELAQPPSVTEGTTKLLEKDE